MLGISLLSLFFLYGMPNISWCEVFCWSLSMFLNGNVFSSIFTPVLQYNATCSYHSPVSVWVWNWQQAGHFHAHNMVMNYQPHQSKWLFTHSTLVYYYAWSTTSLFLYLYLAICEYISVCKIAHIAMFVLGAEIFLSNVSTLWRSSNFICCHGCIFWVSEKVVKCQMSQQGNKPTP